jgi:hypothetical protein
MFGFSGESFDFELDSTFSLCWMCICIQIPFDPVPQGSAANRFGTTDLWSVHDKRRQVFSHDVVKTAKHLY